MTKKRAWESKHDETTPGTVSNLSDHADYTTASPPDQNTGCPASNVNITRSIAVPGAHDENCNVNITALEGLGDSFSDD